HELLTLDDSLAVVLVGRSPEVRLQDRGRRLLRLEEQRIAAAGSLEIKHPAARADAADPHDLAGDVDELVPVDEDAPLGREAAAVLPEQAVEDLLLVADREPLEE